MLHKGKRSDLAKLLRFTAILILHNGDQKKKNPYCVNSISRKGKKGGCRKRERENKGWGKTGKCVWGVGG